MKRYLDPKNDLIFKRIFGEHPDLLISFLNALMPLPASQRIESVEYLQPEMVPDNPLKKNTIVDVRCTDNHKRQFIVEMQMIWSPVFNKRLLLNGAKAYTRQLRKGDDPSLLKPVYALGILADIFDRETDEFYHHFQIVNRQNTDEMLEGMDFLMIELPKFKPEKLADRRMAVLWLRFLREMEDETTFVADELLEDGHIRQAVDMCEEAAFTDAERAAYDLYWENIANEKGLISSSFAQGEEKGKAEGRAEGKAEGWTEGKAEGWTEGKAEGEAERQKLVNALARELAEKEALLAELAAFKANR
jgi:predicted transposase/invertase (TIGR01784 family)